MKYKVGDVVEVKATKMIGEIVKFRPDRIKEYTVRNFDNNWYLFSEHEIELYKRKKYKTEIELPENTVVEINGRKIYPKRKKNFLDLIETKSVE